MMNAITDEQLWACLGTAEAARNTELAGLCKDALDGDAVARGLVAGHVAGTALIGGRTGLPVDVAAHVQDLDDTGRKLQVRTYRIAQRHDDGLLLEITGDGRGLGVRVIELRRDDGARTQLTLLTPTEAERLAERLIDLAQKARSPK